MMTNSDVLSPKTLGFWIKLIRNASNLSQDALAVASGLTVRTVQRVEAGGRVNLQTRRSLARGLGYEDPGVFEDPAFIETINNTLAEQAPIAGHAQEALHPDHIKLAVTATTSGAHLAALISGADATVFKCDQNIDEKAEREAAVLFDDLRDWGDIWSSLTFTQRLDAQHSFDTALATLTELGLRGYQGRRDAYLKGAEGAKAIPFSIAYLVLVPAEIALERLLVPKVMRSE